MISEEEVIKIVRRAYMLSKNDDNVKAALENLMLYSR